MTVGSYIFIRSSVVRYHLCTENNNPRPLFLETGLGYVEGLYLLRAAVHRCVVHRYVHKLFALPDFYSFESAVCIIMSIS